MNNHYSDPDELFTKSPNVVKFDEAKNEDIKENKIGAAKSKKSVPSNITCHCAGKLHWTL